jgi:hypothetical protein
MRAVALVPGAMGNILCTIGTADHEVERIPRQPRGGDAGRKAGEESLNDQQVNCPERNPGTPSVSSVSWHAPSQVRARSRKQTKLGGVASLLRTSNSPQRQRLDLMERDRAGALWPNLVGARRFELI